MVMVERYGIPSTRIMSVIKAFQCPFREIREGDRILVLTDDAMDPMVWHAAMAALNDRGAEATLCLYTRRTHHCGDPTAAAIEATRGADAVVALTTTALNSGTPGLKKVRAEGGGTGRTPIWLMEENTVEILTEGGGRANTAEVQEIADIQRRVGEIFDRTKWIELRSKSGTSLKADISGMPPNYFAERWGKMPFSRNKKTGKLGAGTWPFGEIHCEPRMGTANGVVVWDTTAHFPPGRWQGVVELHIKDGRVFKIEGGSEADQIREYLKKYGDDNSYCLGGEIALGTNKHCQRGTGMMRSEKKRYGAMHFGIGTGPDRGEIYSTLRLEGITDNITMICDGKAVCEDGVIKV